jgi:hypothetical protein
LPAYLTETLRLPAGWLYPQLSSGRIPPWLLKSVRACSIDYRQFASLAELDAFLLSAPAEAQRFPEAAGDFLASQAFEP